MDSHKESDMTEWLSFSLSLHGFEGRKTAEGECPSYHVIQSTCLIPGNVDLDHLAEVVFVSLFHCQVTLFLSLHIVFFFFWNEVTIFSSLFRNRKLHSTSLRAKLFMPIIWNSSAWEIGLLSHMYSIIYLYQYGLTDIHFILWGIIKKDYLLNLLHCSSCYSFDHWKLIPVFFDITPLFQVFFIF